MQTNKTAIGNERSMDSEQPVDYNIEKLYNFREIAFNSGIITWNEFYTLHF